jgi:hypothetical protein
MKSAPYSFDTSISVTAGAAGGATEAKNRFRTSRISGEIFHVGEENRQFCEIGGVASTRLQGDGKVVKYLRGLRGEIVLADEISRGIERGLA